MRAIHLLCVFSVACLLALPGPTRAEGAASQAASGEHASAAQSALAQAAPTKKSWMDKEMLAVLSGLVALLGTSVPLVAKGFDSVSTAARRKKDLQRIDDLTSLLEKVKKENILTAATQADVCEQIEAEIRTSLQQLSRNREHREKAIAASKKAQEVRTAKAQSDLPLWRRILLLYMPRSMGAWIAHGLVVLYLPVGLTAIAEQDSDLMLGSALLVAVSWLTAWFARKRWEQNQKMAPAAQPGSEPMATASAGTA